MAGGRGCTTVPAVVLLVFLLTSSAQGTDSWLKVWTSEDCSREYISGCGCFNLDTFRNFEFGYGGDSSALPLEYSNERGCVCSDPALCGTYYFSVSSCPVLFNVTTRGSVKLACKKSSL